MASRVTPDRPVVAQPGPATANLREEHDVLLRALGILERAGRRVAAGHRVSGSALTALVDLLRTLADECHHGKEEGHLFPAMRAKGIPLDGPVGRILDEHTESRDYLTTLSRRSSAAERAAAALLYVRLLREHIDTENAVLFPMVDRLFSPQEQEALARGYEDLERRRFGTGWREKLLAELARLDAVVPA